MHCHAHRHAARNLRHFTPPGSYRQERRLLGRLALPKSSSLPCLDDRQPTLSPQLSRQDAICRQAQLDEEAAVQLTPQQVYVKPSYILCRRAALGTVFAFVTGLAAQLSCPAAGANAPAAFALDSKRSAIASENSHPSNRDGMTLAAARATTMSAVRSLESAYSQLIELDSCTAVDNLPDCLDRATALQLASQLADSCRSLAAALPVVGAAVAYDSPPGKRRKGALGALLGSLERVARPGGGRIVDIADLEWLEEVEERVTRALEQLEILCRTADTVLEAAMRPTGGAIPGDQAERAVPGLNAMVSPVAALAAQRQRLAEQVYGCLKDVRWVLESEP